MGYRKYEPGSTIRTQSGKTVLYLGDVAGKQTRTNELARFECTECGEEFHETIGHVRQRNITTCQACRKEYKIGERYGPRGLLLIGKGTGRKYRFQCTCGNEFETIPSFVKNGQTQSCGCYKREQTKKRNMEGKDITGQRFGRLVVISLANGKRSGADRHNIWECKCDCGNICYVATNHLKSGATSSCGCYHSQVTSEGKTKDLTGKRFGRLVVMRRADNRHTPKGKQLVRWKCKCDCGREEDILSTLLCSHKRISCKECSKRMSKGELLVESILIGNHILYEYNSDLGFVFKESQRRGFFDFVLPEHHVVIEYDGEQHHKPIERFGGEEAFQQAKMRDREKEEHLKRIGYGIIRISYEQYDDICENHKILLEEIEKATT